MSLFRRSKAATALTEPDEETQEQAAALAAEDEAEQAAAERAAAAARLRSRQGPLDISEVDDDVERVDLGPLKIQVSDGMELRMEVVEADQSVRSVTAVIDNSQVQLQVFSAPRTFGVWDDIRAELVTEITKQGGTAEEQNGTFGQEILARLPTRTADGRTGHQPTRFVGIDGPRWFLRGVIAGQAVEAGSAASIETVIKNCVVSRGVEALPPRELLQLQLPVGAKRRDRPDLEAADNAADEAAAGGLNPPERGPEIAEIR